MRMACAWNMACAWRVHGTCMVHAWYMHGALLVRQRSAAELHQLLGAAGFVSLTTLPTAGLFSVTVGVKPAAVAAAATEQPPPEVRPTRKRPASPAAEGGEASGEASGKAPAGRPAIEAWKEQKRNSLKEQQEKGVALWEEASSDGEGSEGQEAKGRTVRKPAPADDR